MKKSYINEQSCQFVLKKLEYLLRFCITIVTFKTLFWKKTDWESKPLKTMLLWAILYYDD